MKARLILLLCAACWLSLAGCSPMSKTKSRGEGENTAETTMMALPYVVTPAVEAFFKDIVESSDSGYGYTAAKPVCISNGDQLSSVGLAYYYIANLRGADGSTMEYKGRMSIRNPNYKNEGGTSSAPFLDVYTYKYGDDEIKIYVNIYETGDLFIPEGLSFAGDK